MCLVLPARHGVCIDLRIEDLLPSMRTAPARVWLAGWLLASFACAESSRVDPRPDAAVDAERVELDVGPDGHADTSFDAPIDALGPPDIPLDTPASPFRFRIGNAFAGPVTVCVQNWEGDNVRLPSVGVLPRGAVTGFSERPRGFTRVSWELGDVPLSDEFCNGDVVDRSTSIFTEELEDLTFIVMGVEDWMAEECGATGTETCRFYQSVLRYAVVEPPLFMSSPPRIRVVNASTTGIDTICFSEREYFYPFGMPPFYESLRPVTGIRAGIGGCTDEVFFDWPFDPSTMPNPDDYWSEPQMAATSTVIVLDDGDGGLFAVPWRDAEAR